MRRQSPNLPRRREVVLGWFVSWIIRALRASVRLQFHGDEEARGFEQSGRPFILAFWHRHLLLMRYAYRGRHLATLASLSRDGEIATQALCHLGVHVVRGSSSKEGVSGLRRLLRVAKEGSDIAITPDGPRGPARVVQPGLAFISRVVAYPIVPVSYDASRKWLLRTWDRMIVPAPGAVAHFVFGPSLAPPRSEADEEEVSAALGTHLNELEKLASRLVEKV